MASKTTNLRCLEEEFDLNIAIPTHSVIRNSDGCSSSSNEVKFITKIRHEVGFQLAIENNDTMEKILGNKIQGGGYSDSF